MESSATDNAGAQTPTPLLTRILGAKPGEFGAAAWSFTYFFCLLGAYYMIRPVREAMAVDSGPETIPYLFGGTLIATLLATTVFGWITSRYARKQFLPWVYYFFVVNILLFWAGFSVAIEQGASYVWLGRAFFVWLSVFNLFVVSVFWSFMADLYTRGQARRLFGMITAGGSIGALLGGIATSLLVNRIGFQNIFPLSATLLLIAIFCIYRLRRWVESQQRSVGATFSSDQSLGGSPFAGITHTLRSSYFLAIVAKSVIASLLGTALYMFTAELVQDQILTTNARTQFYSNINNYTNALAFVGQLLIVKQVVARFGIGVSLSLLPVLSIAGFAVLAFEPTLAFVAFLTVARRSLGFAFGKPVTDMLYSVVTPEDKYKVKNFIDTVIYRGGDFVGTWSIRGLVAMLGFAGTATVMVPFAAIWAGIALWLGRDYRRRDELASEST